MSLNRLANKLRMGERMDPAQSGMCPFIQSEILSFKTLYVPG